MDAPGADSSSPPSAAAIRDVTLVSAADEASPPPLTVTSPGAGARVKLMVSYGGRIQPRPHDNTRLSYVGGETKIVALERSARLPALLAKLIAVAPSLPDPICLKYQLPGEDLDALVSITDDDDLEHMMVEYDRLQRNSSSPKTAARLRLFLFPVSPPPPPPSAALLDSARSDRQWLLDAINAVPAPPLPKQPSPSPDFLFGLDEGFVLPPAVKVVVDAHSPQVPENLTSDAPAKPDLTKEDEVRHQIGATAAVPQSLFSADEIQRQIPELHSLEVNPPPKIARNSSEEKLHRVYPTGYQVPSQPEKAAPQATQWADTIGRYASLAPGHDHTVYLVPAATGMYPGFFAAPPRIPPAEAYRDAAAGKAVGGAGGLVNGTEACAGGRGKLAYDSMGRVVYYASVVPTYQAVKNVGFSPLDPAAKAAQPSQIA